MTTFNKIIEFNEKFGVGIGDKTYIRPELLYLRFALIAEEFAELLAATAGENATITIHGTGNYYIDLGPETDWPLDIVETADALGDLDYVVAGTSVAFGIPHDDVVEEIHASNMSKLGADGKPIYREDGKVLKGPNYFKPNIKKILDEK